MEPTAAFFGIAFGTNTLAVFALVFRAGRLVSRLESAEKRIADIEAAKSDISIAKITTEVAGLGKEISELRDEFRNWTRIWARSSGARAGAD